jgi:hypothetical protein
MKMPKMKWLFLILGIFLIPIFVMTSKQLSVTDVTPKATLLAGEIEGPPIKQPAVIDRGLLYGDPCAPPCWENIVPVSMTREEVLEKLDMVQKRTNTSKSTFTIE